MTKIDLEKRISLLEDIIQQLIEELVGVMDYDKYRLIWYYLHQQEYEKVYKILIGEM